MYSDMSKRTSRCPGCSQLAATSVLPTPVGPLNRKAPIGFWGLPRPERDILIALASASMAARSLAKDHVLQVVVEGSEAACRRWRRVAWRDASDLGNDLLGISVLLMSFFWRDLGRMRWAAPASSITSMALSAGDDVDVAGRQFGGARQGRGRIPDAVVLLEARLEAL